jgi:hypothetical protein
LGHVNAGVVCNSKSTVMYKDSFYSIGKPTHAHIKFFIY